MNRRKKQTLVVAAVIGLILWARWDGRPDLTPDKPLVEVTATASTQPPTPNVSQTPKPPKAKDVQPDPEQTAQDLAVRAVTAWQAPTIEERQAGLATLATPGYLTLAATIDPTQVPTAPIVAVTPHTSDGYAVVDVELEDGTALIVDVEDRGGRLYVTDIRPAS